MSGLEVIGGISGVIGIIDAAVKIYNSVQKDLQLPEAFQTVGRRLPVILATLETCKDHLNPKKDALATEACDALEKIIESCDDKAGKLRQIFEKSLPGESDGWKKRYLKVVTRLGKGNKVEELMLAITEDVQLMVNHHAVAPAKPDQVAELNKIIQEMKFVPSSLPEETGSALSFHSGGGAQTNNVNSGSGQQINNNASIGTQNFVSRPKEDLSFHQPMGACLTHAPGLDSSLFVGRDAEIVEMEDRLMLPKATQEQRQLVLGGLGGIGKTQLAISFAKRHHNQYTSIFWLDATSEATLQDSFQRTAGQIFGVQDRSVLDGEQSLVHTHRWLSDPYNTQWLLIFDNYDDPDQFKIKKYYPPVSHGTIIVTTRRPDRVVGLVIRLQPLPDVEDSLEILRTRSHREDTKLDPHARQLAERLGGLPLALATAGAYLHQSCLTFQRYLEEYERRWNLDLRRPTQLPEYEDRTLHTTWNLSYTHLESHDPEAARLLRYLAYFENQSVWYELLRAGVNERSTLWLRELTADDVAFDCAMRTLTEYCFLEVPTAAQAWSMHACVHDWTLVALNQKIDVSDYWSAFDSITTLITQIPWEELGSLSHARLNAHAAWLVTDHFYRNERIGQISSMRCTKAHRAAELLRKRSQLVAGEKMYLRALRGYETAWGPDHTSTLDTVNNLAILYADQGKMKEAEEMYLRALRGYETAWGPDHTSTLDTINNLGLLYADQGKMKEAEEMYLRALRGKKTAWGPDHTSALDTVNNLAILYADQGKMKEAEEMYLRALQGYETAWGPDHTSTLDTVNNLAILYADQGKMKEAEEMYLRALRGKETAWGPDHTSTLDTVNNLGSLYADQGKMNEAEEMYLRALRGYETAWGPGHTSTLRTVNNLGILYKHQGKMKEAEEMFKRIRQ